MSGGHTIPMSMYLKVISILLFLTVVTVWVAQINLGVLNTVVAMAVASVKAWLVLAYFMHLKYDDKMFRVIFAVSIFFLLVMFAFSYGDIATRIAQHSTL